MNDGPTIRTDQPIPSESSLDFWMFSRVFEIVPHDRIRISPFPSVSACLERFSPPLKGLQYTKVRFRSLGTMYI